MPAAPASLEYASREYVEFAPTVDAAPLLDVKYLAPEIN
jgi:hypothetical protein